MNNIIFIFISILGCAAPSFAEPQKIVVRAESQLVDQKVVALSDVADLSGFTPALLARVKNIEIIDAPLRGERRHFTNIGLAQILRQRLSKIEEAQKIELVIPNEVIITKKNLKITTAEIEGELLSELQKQCHNCDFEISGLALPIINQDLPDGATWKIKISNQLPKGSFSLPLEIKYEDNTRRLYWLGGTVNVRKLVPVAKHNILVGENIKAEDYRFEKHEITFVNDNIAIEDDLKVAVAARTIMANQVIEAAAIRKQSAIRLGDIVKVIIGEDAWQVSMEGVAQQNAYKGDMVKVKIGHTQKIISGIAMDKGLVEAR